MTTPTKHGIGESKHLTVVWSLIGAHAMSCRSRLEVKHENDPPKHRD